ncbi:MAG: tetratricopeptide repeat protein [Pirellulaceae bacterium]
MSQKIEEAAVASIAGRSSRRRTRDQIKIFFGLIFATLSILILANSFFIYASSGPSEMLALMLQIHGWLGMGLTGAMVGYSIPHYLQRRKHGNKTAKFFGYILAISLTAACVLGSIVFFQGRNESATWIVRGHELGFGIALTIFLVHRLSAVANPLWRYELGGLATAGALFLGFWLAQPQNTEDGLNNGVPKVTMAEAKRTAVFKATSATTITGHALNEDDLANSEYCAQCHAEIAQQWRGSAHRFSSMNDPIYEKTISVLQQNRKPEAMHFCGGCHDPLVLLTGNMEGEFTRDTPNAHQGITCLACHAVVEVRDRRGNAGYVVAPPEHYPYYGSSDPKEQQLNLDLIRAKPEKHKASFLKEFHRTSEFCLTCHKTFLTEPVNHYRWKRGANDYDAWFDSNAGLNNALTFYNAKEVKSCQECHMPDVASQDPAAKDGLARDHTFPGSNSALPTFHNKPEWLEKTKAITKDVVKVDIFSAIDANQLEPENRIYPLDRPDARFAPGSEMRVEVLVKNTKVGHMFPGGTMDINEPWLEFIVADESGKPLLASGLLSSDKRLDPTAHRFDVMLLSKESRLIDTHNVEHFRTDLYNNSIPLGQTEIVRFQFKVPEDAAGKKLKLTARVRFRKLNQQYINFVFGKDAPEFPILEYGRHEVTVQVGEPQKLPVSDDVEVSKRLRDFSIGSFRHRDTLTALWGFKEVARLQPMEPDSYIDMCRCYIQVGDFGENMAEALRKANEVNPKFPKTGFFLGRMLTAQSKFDEAVQAFDSTLAVFPDDRMVNNAKGIALFKAKKYEEAIKVLAHSLDIDPDNVDALNYTSLAYRQLGNEEKAKEHEELFLRYQPQESEKAVHELYRRRNPNADREANLQHVHPVHSPDDIERIVKEGEEYRFPHSAIQPNNKDLPKALPQD